MIVISFLRKHWLFTITVLPIVCVTLYLATLKVFFDYEIGTNWNMGHRQLERALAAKNPDYCSRIIVIGLAPGPARYDIMNGCYAGYANETGDVSMCMNVIAPGLCVSAIAEKRNDPDLCEQAWAPERRITYDRRGSCFGYFAKRERD